MYAALMGIVRPPSLNCAIMHDFCDFVLNIFVTDTSLSRPLFAVTTPNRTTFNAYYLHIADDARLIAVCIYYIPIIEFSPIMLCRSDRPRHGVQSLIY